MPEKTTLFFVAQFSNESEADMPNTLNKYEKETVILYNQSSDPVTISTYDPALRRKLEDYAARFPDLCRRTDKHKYPDYAEYEINKDRLFVRFTPPYSEERKQAAAERMKKLNDQSTESI